MWVLMLAEELALEEREMELCQGQVGVVVGEQGWKVWQL